MMMKETGTNSKKFIWRQRIGFGISDYACNLAYLMVNTYLLIFYTDVAGIPAASAAFMFLITKFIDAFTDYMVGALVDRTNTKTVSYTHLADCVKDCEAVITIVGFPQDVEEVYFDQGNILDSAKAVSYTHLPQ